MKHLLHAHHRSLEHHYDQDLINNVFNVKVRQKHYTSSLVLFLLKVFLSRETGQSAIVAWLTQTQTTSIRLTTTVQM